MSIYFVIPAAIPILLMYLCLTYSLLRFTGDACAKSALVLFQIYLMPQSLARKRVWNKKYPICIELAKQDDFLSKAQGEKVDSAEDKPTVPCEKALEKVEKPEGPPEEAKGPIGGGDLTIYLFGRTGREKEEWFRRFLLASRLKLETRLPAVSKSGETCMHSFYWT